MVALRRSRRIRGTRYAPMLRRPSVWLFLLVSVALLVLFGFGIKADREPVQLQHVLIQGTNRLFRTNIALDGRIEGIVLILYLLLLRRFRLALLAWRPGAIEIRPLENAVEGIELKPEELRALFASFREDLGRPKLYGTTSVPGDGEPDRLYKVFESTAGGGGWAAFVSSALSYTFPSRAYVVTATLRTRVAEPRFGVSVQVRRLPHAAEELEPQWSGDFQRALQRAAYAAAAHIVPNTRASSKAPWTGWQGKTIPVSLFRDYQRAKRMVGERRYDEALALYHSALLRDGGNVDIRYDMAQVYERRHLYSDALSHYLELVELIFPAFEDESSGPRQWRRTSRPTWWPASDRDPFSIRYRYVTTLSFARPLADDLLRTGWPGNRPPTNARHEERPWRVTELADLRHRIAAELDRLRGIGTPDRPALLEIVHRLDTARAALAEGIHSQSAFDHEYKEILDQAELFFAEAAQHESRLLEEDYRRYHSGWLRLARRSRLTLVVIRQNRILADLRADRCADQHDRRVAELNGVTPPPPGRGSWPPSVAALQQKLAEIGYRRSSREWQEHYNAACLYALPLVFDTKEEPAHEEYAKAAVQALDRAWQCGEDLAFARSKRYWLSAGDPDLSGLRLYGCYRAFEGRVYVLPSPDPVQLVEHELDEHLHRLLINGAKVMEEVWEKRAELCRRHLAPCSVFEGWWLEEREAWHFGVRLGRFHDQWQTRWQLIETLREWRNRSQLPPLHLPYPEIAGKSVSGRNGHPADGDRSHRPDSSLPIREMLAVLGRLGQTGAESADPDASLARLHSNTMGWISFAEQNTRTRLRDSPADSQQWVEVCLRRSGLWASLRQWSDRDSLAGRAEFDGAVLKLLPAPVFEAGLGGSE